MQKLWDVPNESNLRAIVGDNPGFLQIKKLQLNPYTWQLFVFFQPNKKTDCCIRTSYLVNWWCIPIPWTFPNEDENIGLLLIFLSTVSNQFVADYLFTVFPWMPQLILPCAQPTHINGRTSEILWAVTQPQNIAEPQLVSPNMSKMNGSAI